MAYKYISKKKLKTMTIKHLKKEIENRVITFKHYRTDRDIQYIFIITRELENKIEKKYKIPKEIIDLKKLTLKEIKKGEDEKTKLYYYRCGTMFGLRYAIRVISGEGFSGLCCSIKKMKEMIKMFEDFKKADEKMKIGNCCQCGNFAKGTFKTCPLCKDGPRFYCKECAKKLSIN